MKFLQIVKRKTKEVLFSDSSVSVEKKISSYMTNGRIPWSEGYTEYKTQFISNVINSPDEIYSFKEKMLAAGYATGIDERSVEYPWIFSKLSNNPTSILDAGSTFNFDYIVNQDLIKKKSLTIYTYFPEKDCFFEKRINYVFGDLRSMFFVDNYFEEIVCQSTIEHIDMDNSIYGYGSLHKNEVKSYEYLLAVKEMFRVLKPGGSLLITFPFGKYEYHGFFQQFDSEMLDRILDFLNPFGKIEVDYFNYQKEGWEFSTQSSMANVESYNPHTGKGKGNDGAAHCRGIVCINFIKKLV